MRALLAAKQVSAPLNAEALRDQPNAIQRRLKPLLDLAEHSDYLVAGSAGGFVVGRGAFQIPRFIFMGPAGGGETMRLGLFAGLHGDETEGAEAVVEFLRELETSPQIARGFHIYAYPICNPTGFVAGTRLNLSGEDLAEHFWRGSSQPEIYYLEREMGVLRFQGVVSLRTEKQGNSFNLNVSSDILNRALVPPAIRATEKFLTGRAAETGGHAATHGNLPASARPNFLTDTDELKPAPFELHIGLPGKASQPARVHGTVAALKSVLDSYRSLVSISQNI